SPIPRADGVDVRGVGYRRLVAREHSQQRRCMGREQIFPTEVGDDAVLGPAFAPDRFHQPDVLVDAPTRAFDFHGAQEHSVSLSKTRHCYLSTLVRSTTNSRQRGHIVSLGFTWIRQAIIVFRPFSEHSGVKGRKNLRTWASRPAPPAKNAPNSQVVPREARLLGAREALLRRAPKTTGGSPRNYRESRSPHFNGARRPALWLTRARPDRSCADRRRRKPRPSSPYRSARSPLDTARGVFPPATT